MKYFWFYFGIVGCQCAFAADSPAPDLPPARARVVIVEQVGVMVAFRPDARRVETMLNQGVSKLTGATNLAKAWQTIVSPRDVVGIKVYSGPGANSGTRPAVVAAVIEGLLNAGIPAKKIIIWDKQLKDLRAAGFDDLARRYKVRLAGSANTGYDAKVAYDNSVLGNLVSGDMEFDLNGTKTGRKSFVSKLLTSEITKIIVVSPLLNHNLAGVCGNLYSLATGSVDNTLRFEAEAERLATAVPEIYALPALSDHVALNIIDALIGQYQGEQTSLLHYSTELNQLWLSKDPVALDVLAIQELERERQAAQVQTFEQNLPLYQNASLLELGVSDLSRIRLEMVK